MNDSAENNANRSAEEIAWDEEFSNMKGSSPGIAAGMADLLALAVKVPAALLQMPLNMLPPEAARHARTAAREGFLAVRSLLDALGDGIEDLLAEPDDQSSSTVSGPQGTWGTARQSTVPVVPSGKAKKIEVSDDSTPAVAISPAEMESTEGRGLRADIDY
ncbi:MAG: hypothetical protein IVW55_01550 [Chloroflexi bacterium]|nr:hypothetical protein [Chloroflexota bacterium]